MVKSRYKLDNKDPATKTQVILKLNIVLLVNILTFKYSRVKIAIAIQNLHL